MYLNNYKIEISSNEKKETKLSMSKWPLFFQMKKMINLEQS